ncbi:MAG TPA: hypothetical protein VLU25_20525 [Acidobacteriota bacterium]|nr:hypothetical protein [Acidobacteriota bacterium]
MTRKHSFAFLILLGILWTAPAWAQEADLVLTKETVPPDRNSMLSGGLISYRVEVTNQGPDAATDVELTDDIIDIFVSMEASEGASCQETPLGIGFGRQVTCTWAGPTGVGETRTLEFTARSFSSTPCNAFLVSDRAQASSATLDPNNGNNRQTGVMGGMVAAIQTENFTQAGWETMVMADSPSVEAGDQLTYTINLANLGPSDAEVTVAHRLPAGWTVDSIDVLGDLFDPGELCTGLGTEVATCTFFTQSPFSTPALPVPDTIEVVANVPPLVIPRDVEAETTIESENCLADMGDTLVRTVTAQLGPFDLHFAQFGGGDGFTSDIVLTNPSSFNSAAGVLRFFGPNGQPLAIEFLDDTDVGPVTSHEFVLPPHGGLRLRSDPDGPFAIGSASLNASAEVGGVIRFRIPNVGIAGVPGSTPIESAIVPVRQQDGVRTGLAIRNLRSDGNSLITLSLRGFDGVEVAGGAGAEALQANARLSLFIDELFPSAELTDFEGVVVLESNAPLAATGLELGDDPGEFTTLPVTPLQILLFEEK